MRVFLGSTYLDLRDHRTSTIEALTGLSVQVDAMELWFARPEDSLSVCLQRVEEADVYVCVVAMRYGARKRFKSFTHLEYDHARRLGKRCLVFVIDDGYPVPTRFVDFGFAAWRLRRLKAQLRRNHLVSHFGSPDDLAHRVVESVRDLLVEEQDEQARALNLNEFWKSLSHRWERVSPSDLRIPFAPHDDIADLLDKLEREVEGVEDFHKVMSQSHEALPRDLEETLHRIGADPGTIKSIPYYENPFVLRDAEFLMLFPNRLLRINALIAQARVKAFEGVAEKGDSRVDKADLDEAKSRLESALSKIQVD